MPRSRSGSAIREADGECSAGHSVYPPAVSADRSRAETGRVAATHRARRASAILRGYAASSAAIRVWLTIVLSVWACAVSPAIAAPSDGGVAAPTAADRKGVERLYREGILSDGQPLRGLRPEDTSVEGRDAACARCHRRSGLGTAEGKIIIPSISGAYPYEKRSRNLEDMDQVHESNVGRVRPAYTAEGLERAIRDGIGADGLPLNAIMPRYPLDSDTLRKLVEYMNRLGRDDVPGVTADTLRFATVVTPDADPAARDGMLAVLETFFRDRNHIIAGEAKPLKHRHGIVFRVTRKWELDVWRLEGPPASWEAQLDEKMRTKPVFAVVSGLAGRDWAPVHRFCETRTVPCLFPNTDLPVVQEQDFYPVYFSRGVLLEADLIGSRLVPKDGVAASPRLVQVFRKSDIGHPAAVALANTARAAGLQVVDRELAEQPEAGDIAAALRGLGPDDMLALWLRGEDIAALPAEPARVRAVFISGLMGGMENAPLPESWRPLARMAYPAELPERRQVAMTHPLGWLRIKGIPVGSERVQVHTYLACQILSETLGEMLDSFVRDYLIERVEVMLSHRKLSAYYPRLGLAQEQRFASKGGYLVRFAEPRGSKLIADSEWLTP